MSETNPAMVNLDPFRVNAVPDVLTNPVAEGGAVVDVGVVVVVVIVVDFVVVVVGAVVAVLDVVVAVPARH